MKLFQWLEHWSKEIFSPLPVKKIVEVEVTIACYVCGKDTTFKQPKSYPKPIQVMCEKCTDEYYPTMEKSE